MLLAAAALGVGAAMAIGATPAPETWNLADPIPHVFDVAGPRSDGTLVVAAAGKLFLLDPSTGALKPFAGGPGGYPGAGGEEPYIAVAPASQVGNASFPPGDVFVLQLKPSGGILRIDPSGVAHQFANVTGVDSLNGITFDETGQFGYRLLVTGPHAHHTTVAAIDGEGQVSVITRQAPIVEGGIAVAPPGFGKFAGDLIAPDELSGKLYAISPDGASHVIARPDFAHGGDVGVEGVGFIPEADISGVTAYFADRGTPGNPHPGSDNLLALTGPQLARAGARPGDALVATEGGAGMVAVRCDLAVCTVIPIIHDNGVSHGEGHILVVLGTPSRVFGPAPASLRSESTGIPTTLVATLIVGGGLVVALLFWSVRRRRDIVKGNS